MANYSLAACEELIEKYTTEYGGIATELEEGVLGLGTQVLHSAPNKKTIIITEYFISAWKSGHKIRKYNKMPKKYAALVEANEIELDTVIFRKDSHGVFAIFPYIIADTRGSVTTYQHVGQHSAGAYDVCINSSKPATEEEYQDLKEELESMGYNLKIGKQRHWETYIKALRICQGY